MITAAIGQEHNEVRDQIDANFNEMLAYLHRDWLPYRGRLYDYRFERIRHCGEVRVMTNVPLGFVRL